MIEVKFKGDAELAKMLERVAKDFPREKQLFLKQEAENLKTRVKLKTPVRTTNLRESWESGEVEGDSIEVGNPVEYSLYVEFPHRQFVYGRDSGRITEGNYMLRDAVEETEENFNTDARAILRRLFT